MQEDRTKPRRVRARAIEWAGRPGGPCAQCGDEVEHLQIDHVVPYCEGGRHHLSNIQWLCKPCHQRKSAAEMLRHRAKYPHLYAREPMSEERRREVAALFAVTKSTPEANAKRSESMRQAWARKSPEERQAIAEKAAAKNRGRKEPPRSEEHCRKISEAQKRKWASGTRKPNASSSHLL